MCVQFKAWPIQFCLWAVLFFSLSARAQFTFVTNADNTLTLTAYNGFQSTVTIPDTTNGYPITAIGYMAFNCQPVAQLQLPSGLERIGSGAFNGCINLTSVVLGASLKSIGVGAFALTPLTSVTIPAGVTNIDPEVFSDCPGLTNIEVVAANTFYSSVGGVLFDKTQTTLVEFPNGLAGSYTIPSGVTNIGSFAFDSCKLLTNIVVPASVTQIKSYAFSYCSILQSLHFQGNAPSTDGTIFYLANSALTVYYQPDTTGWGANLDSRSTVEIWPYVPFNYNSANGAVTITGYIGTNRSVVIPDSIHGLPVASIGDWAFMSQNITNVTIPDVVTVIGSFAFDSCTNLASVTLGNGMANIEGEAFWGCTNLSHIELTANITNIGGGAFFDCSSLGEVVIPNNVTTIGGWAFAFCSSLTNVVLSTNLTSISDTLFGFCYGLTKINIPNQVTSIEDSAFGVCTQLESLTIQAGVTNIGVDAFANCLSLKSVVLPNSVQSLGEGAFLYCVALTNVVFSTNLTRIEDLTFAECYQLTAVSMPDCITNIGVYAFADCQNLIDLHLPNSLITLGDGVFDGCLSLVSIFMPSSVTTIGGGAFNDSPNLRGVYLLGNAPSLGNETCFSNTPNVAVYYFPGTMGWGTTFSACPTSLWLPQMQTVTANFSSSTNYFMFNLNWASGETVVVEACTNLSNPVWLPVQTNTLTTGTATFTDPEAAKYPGRFYRLHSL